MSRGNVQLPDRGAKRGYLDLINRFPLRLIRSAADHKAAMKVLNDLMARGDENLDAGEIDYLRVLAKLVSLYETAKSPSRTVKPLDALKFLMEQHGLRSNDLGRILGSPSAASNVLAGGRELSKAHIVKLAMRFNVSPALFIDMSNESGRRPSKTIKRAG